MRTYYESSLLIALTLLLLLGIGVANGAPKFPEKPITIVVFAGAGSGVDVLARFIAAANDKQKFLPQPIIVENKPGGSSAVANAYVASKKKDPYFLLTVTGLILTTPMIGQSTVNYKDFTPICNFSFDEHMLLVNSNSRFKSLKDLVTYAKANPETVTMGGAHMGGAESINTFRFEKAAGVKLKYVGFGGGGDAIVALLGGHVDLGLVNPSETLELIKANKVRSLGVLTEKRLVRAPDIPTIMEQGIDVTGFGIYRGLVAPGGIPEDARKIIEEALFKLTKTEEYKKYHMDNVLTEAWMDGPTFGQFLDKKNHDYAAVYREMGLIKK